MYSSEYEKGHTGEIIVRRELQKLNPNIYFTLNDITVETNTTTQIDHLVISIYGLFVIETKSHSGLILTSNRMWTQYLGKHKSTFLNPYVQNQQHINVLSKLLELPKDNFMNIVVFTSSDVKFKSDIVIKPEELNLLIQSYTLERLNLNTCTRILTTIETTLCKDSTHINRLINKNSKHLENL